MSDDASGEANPKPYISIQTANTQGTVVIGAAAAPQSDPAEPQSEGDNQKEPEKGEPVVATSGLYVERWREFTLPGTIPLDVWRVYRPAEGLKGPLGRHRTSLFDSTFVVDPENRLVYRDGRGRRILFKRPFNFLASFNTKYRHLALRASWLKRLELEDGRLRKRFYQGKDKVYRLVEIEDENANRIAFLRDAKGLLQQARHSDGYELAFENDGAGRRLAVALTVNDATMPLVTYAYDTQGNLLVVDCATAFRIRYDYDSQNRLIAWRDRTGRTECHFDYDSRGRVVRTRTSGTWDGDRFAYDDEARRTRYFPGGGEAAEQVEYDADGRVTADTDCLAATTRFEFDSDGYLTKIIDPAGHATALAHDDMGKLKNRTDREGRRELCRGASIDQPSVLIDGAGGVRRFDYDENGNLAAMRDPMGHETKYDWTPAGRLAAIHRPDGTSEQRRYDPHHRLTAVIDAKGGVKRFSRDDPFGRVTAITDALGHTTRFGYEDVKAKPFDLPTWMTRPDGTTVKWRFDAEGKIAACESGANRPKLFRYGAFDQLRAIEDPAGGEISFAYDVRGNVTTVTSAMGTVYHYDRDAAGRVVAEADFDGRRLSYVRDKVGRIVEQQNADGSRVTFAYDRSGLLTRRCAYAPGVDPGHESAPEEDEIFAYDGRGLVIRAENKSGVVTFVRDRAGRILSETANGRTIEGTFDTQGRRIERRIGGDLTRYTLDPIGALTAITLESGSESRTITFHRDALGRETGRDDGPFELAQQFDAMGRLRSQRVSAATSGSNRVGLERHYEWCEAGPTSIVDAKWGRTDYAYDANERVVEARHGGGLPSPLPNASAGLVGLPGDLIEIERFTYLAGNAIAASDTALPGERLDRALTPWQTTRGGKVETARGPRGEQITLTHDAQGRVIERQIECRGEPTKTWRFEWNALDRLIACETPNGKIWRYAYDPFGRRVSKHGPDDETCAYSWDGDHIAFITDRRNSAEGLIWHYEPDSFRPIAVQEFGSVRILHVVTDHLGTPRELFDDHGECRWSRSGRLWGGRREPPRGRAHEAFDACPIRFPGQWADSESGLTYNRFRYYDPETATYLSCDPTGLAGGLNTQGYVSRPLAQADPLGLSPKDASAPPSSVIPNPNDISALTSVAASTVSGSPVDGLEPTQVLPGTEFQPSLNTA